MAAGAEAGDAVQASRFEFPAATAQWTWKEPRDQMGILKGCEKTYTCSYRTLDGSVRSSAEGPSEREGDDGRNVVALELGDGVVDAGDDIAVSVKRIRSERATEESETHDVDPLPASERTLTPRS